MTAAKRKSQLLFRTKLALTLSIACVATLAAAQTTSPGAPAQSPATAPVPAPTNEPPHGTVLFQSHGEPPAADSAPEVLKDWQTAEKSTGTELSDMERDAISFTAYDLDVRLRPAASSLSARARLKLRNDGEAPLARVALQISSSLRWESASLFATTGSTKLELAQHLIDTDADHMGRANEAILLLPTPLKPGESITVDTFYSGTVAVSTGRLERLGASHAQALTTDWDEVSSSHTALRGFGNVLWYPVAAPQLFLGEGAQLFEAIGKTELREQNARMRFHLGVEYAGDPPVAAYFCGRRQPLVAQSDSPDSSTAAGSGIATADFAEQALGFRLPSLVVVEKQETMLAPLPSLPVKADATSSSSSSSSTETPQASEQTAEAPATGNGAPMLAVESDDTGALPSLVSAAQQVAPLLESWLGQQPLSALTIIDNAGQPFEDGPLLLAPVGSLVASTEAPAIAHSLTHAWVQTGQPWMDEGLAQFFALLWVERTQGRDAAVLQLNNLMQPVSLAEPNIEQGKPAPAGQPLIAATSEAFFRRKAAAVWFMLREAAGEDALKRSLRAWRTQPLSHAAPEEQARAFETLLEKQSGKDLRWFFDDWVMRDRGLPDLAIAEVASRQLPAGKGHSSGWLVAVTVHNDGAAAAEVPVVVRSGTFSTTSTLRITGFESATARVLVETAPTEIMVNDGSVPEVQNARHVREIVAETPTH